jgi:hypothetical protein
MEADPEDVEGRLHQRRRDTGDHPLRGVVGEHDVPRTVEHDARIRIVGPQQPFQRCPHVMRRRIVDGGLVVARRIARGEQH